MITAVERDASRAQAVGETLAGARSGYLTTSISQARSMDVAATRVVTSAPKRISAAASKRTALIIGINKAKGGRPLPGSVTDATNLRDALLGYGFPAKNITTLLDRAGTRSAILAHLDALAARTPSDGVAVFAVATHTRRRGGTNELLTADGLRISAGELASRLGRVRAPMWVALPTCYAGGYAVKGIVGPKRIATFASPKDQPTYQLGTAGSYLMIHMVRKAMLEGRAPGSVEDAFGYAKESLEQSHPNRVPMMSDGIDGDLVLGDTSFGARMMRSPVRRSGPGRPGTVRPADARPRSGGEQGADPAPSPTPAPRRKGNVGVCGKFAYNCSDR